MTDEILNVEKIVETISEKVEERLKSKGLFLEASNKNNEEAGKRREKRADLSTKLDSDEKLASVIDHTLLKPEASIEDLIKVCDEAKQYNCATVCVNSSNIPFVARELEGTNVKPIAVVGFPLGAATSQSKAFEAQEAIKAGAREIDMVVNIGALKSKDYKLVYEDIALVVEVSKPYPVKVIIEASDITEDEKIAACVLAKSAEAAFVKTSTGFGKGGATIEDVALMRRIVGEDMLVKASGGIRTTKDARSMIEAGADRIGASATIAIVTGKSSSSKGY